MDVMENKSLIIWFNNGGTGKYEMVSEFKEELGLGYIMFEYFGISTQVRRKATFMLKNIAGYAFEK